MCAHPTLVHTWTPLSFFASSYTHLSWPWYQSTRLTWESSSEFIAGGRSWGIRRSKIWVFLFLIGPGKNNFQWMGKKYTQKWKESEESGRTQEEIALGGQASRWQQIQGDLFRGQTEWDNWMNQQQQNWSLSLSTYLLYLFLQVSDPALSVQWTDEHMDKFCYFLFWPDMCTHHFSQKNSYSIWLSSAVFDQAKWKILIITNSKIHISILELFKVWFWFLKFCDGPMKDAHQKRKKHLKLWGSPTAEYYESQYQRLWSSWIQATWKRPHYHPHNSNESTLSV